MRYLLLAVAVRSFSASFLSSDSACFFSPGSLSSATASAPAATPSAITSVRVRAMVCLPVRSLVLLLPGLLFEQANGLAQLAHLAFQGHQALVEDRVVLAGDWGDDLHLGVSAAGL